MKISKSAILLSAISALFLAVYAGIGLFSSSGPGKYFFTSLHGQIVEISGRGLYHFDTVFFAAGFRGNDVISLFLVFPSMIAAILLYRKRSVRAALILCGLLAYTLYNSFSMGTSAAYNAVFLLYTAVFSASLFGMLTLCRNVDSPPFQQPTRSGKSVKVAAIYLVVAGTTTAFLWLSDILPALIQGTVPALLGPYTTTITYFVDMAIISPACMLAGLRLLKGDGGGFILGFILLFLLMLTGLVVVIQTIFQIAAGISFPPGQLIGMIGSWVVMGSVAAGFVISMIRNVHIPETKI